MHNSACSLHNQFGESLKWPFTGTLGWCVYDIFDEIAFFIGWISVAIWTVALLPQIITNFKKKSAESQSFWFWILWVFGDLCNFVGAIMTKNLITNISLAFVYLVLTAVACLQFIWYEYMVKKYGKNNQAPKLRLNINTPTPTIDRHTLRPLEQSTSTTSFTMWNTPKFATKYQSPSTTDMTPKLKSALAILSRTPRMFAISPQLTSEMKHEFENIQVLQRAVQSVSYSDPDATSVNAPILGKTGSIMSTLTFMSVTVVMLYGLQSTSDYADINNNNLHSTSRILLHGDDGHSAHFEAKILVIGLVLGWIAAVIYIVSRIPQLRLMLQTQDVSGINPLFFGLTFIGNFTQCLSMLINKQIYHDAAWVFNKLPWLVTCGTCALQDGFILLIIFLYRKRTNGKRKKQFLLDQH